MYNFQITLVPGHSRATIRSSQLEDTLKMEEAENWEEWEK
jgi:hypothetical protein